MLSCVGLESSLLGAHIYCIIGIGRFIDRAFLHPRLLLHAKIGAMTERSIFAIYAFILGTMVGSFANVCIYRMPKELSVIAPRSRCHRCGTKVAWYDNLPVVSYFWLCGRCRACGSLFGVGHVVVECMIGVIASWIYLRHGVSFQSVYVFILTTALVVVSAIDLEHRIIPDTISIYGTYVGLALSAVFTWLGLSWFVPFTGAVVGALVGAGMLWGVGVLYEHFTGREGIGFGDVKLLALFGAHTGVEGVLTSLFFGSLLGSMAGLSLMVLHGKGSRSPIPFGPFLCLGLLIYAFGGQGLLFRLFTP
jgi:leader peptidase (prepilin peptidase)/N-methyltransferase